MPTMRPGCFIPAASEVIDSDDVFDARIASGATTTLELAKELALDVEVLDDRLDDELGADQVAERVHRGRSGRSPHRLRRASSLPLAASFASASPICFFAVVGGAHPGVEQLHAMAVQRGDLRDAGAHRAGADDGDHRALRQRGGHRRTRQCKASALRDARQAEA